MGSRNAAVGRMRPRPLAMATERDSSVRQMRVISELRDDLLPRPEYSVHIS